MTNITESSSNLKRVAGLDLRGSHLLRDHVPVAESGRFVELLQAKEDILSLYYGRKGEYFHHPETLMELIRNAKMHAREKRVDFPIKDLEELIIESSVNINKNFRDKLAVFSVNSAWDPLKLIDISLAPLNFDEIASAVVNGNGVEKAAILDCLEIFISKYNGYYRSRNEDQKKIIIEDVKKFFIKSMNKYLEIVAELKTFEKYLPTAKI